MRTPDIHTWCVKWNSNVRIVAAPSKFAAKKLAKREFYIPIDVPLEITKAVIDTDA